ncbi:MAG: 1,4-alpha-glucan branching protein GlgB [Pseudomonadota bacterium]
MNEQIERLQNGTHHDPFEFLGRHPDTDGEVFRAFMPMAEEIELVGYGKMTRVEGSDLFEAHLDSREAAEIPQHFKLRCSQKTTAAEREFHTPYSFGPQVGDLDLHLFGQGRHKQAWKFLGAHMRTIDGVSGCLFSIWLPNVQRISVVGDFNGWNGLRHPLRNRGHSGIWEIFIPGLQPGDSYKYEIRSREDHVFLKADPYGQQMAHRPDTTSVIASEDSYTWQDNAWLEQRASSDWQHQPMSIYEIHAGSWRVDDEGEFLNFRELAKQLVPYVRDLGYTHIELLPVMEHPLDESWGYQVTGYFAPSSRYGSPDDFRYFVDLCHQQDIGVILDCVPAHFPKDDFALARLNGETLYEHANPKRGEHMDWGTLIFDYGRSEVRNFLIANALYWIEEFHIDGLRVDAVASMLYLDYSREEGQWDPNEFGGRENLEAIAFMREGNEVIHADFPGVITIAEESTAFPMVSRPTSMGGLGYSMKWNMGWMHDTLSYFEADPVHRQHHQDSLTFSQLYAYTENFVLPFSHDEVVHLKGSMLEKMPGDNWQKFANLRLLYTYQMTHPGKKLQFMGSEFGQWEEWNEKASLDWPLLEVDTHKGVSRLVADLNHLYRESPALYYHDFDSQGFQWIDCTDREQSVISFLRHGPEGSLVVIFNFTPVPRETYRIGVPAAAAYREILNSDSDQYGGSGKGNSGVITTDAVAYMGFEQSIELTLPPLAGLILQASG